MNLTYQRRSVFHNIFSGVEIGFMHGIPFNKTADIGAGRFIIPVKFRAGTDDLSFCHGIAFTGSVQIFGSSFAGDTERIFRTVIKFNFKVSVGETAGHIGDRHDLLTTVKHLIRHILDFFNFAGLQAFTFDFSHCKFSLFFYFYYYTTLKHHLSL